MKTVLRKKPWLGGGGVLRKEGIAQQSLSDGGRGFCTNVNALLTALQSLTLNT